MVWASGTDASWSPPFGGGPGTLSWEEAPGQTQVEVERLYLCTGLGTPRDPPVRAANVAREKEVWGPTLKLLLP